MFVGRARRLAANDVFDKRSACPTILAGAIAAACNAVRLSCTHLGATAGRPNGKSDNTGGRLSMFFGFRFN